MQVTVKCYINGQRRVTEIAVMPIYGKNLKSEADTYENTI